MVTPLVGTTHTATLGYCAVVLDGYGYLCGLALPRHSPPLRLSGCLSLLYQQLLDISGVHSREGKNFLTLLFHTQTGVLAVLFDP
jgi:hypothetical protein